MSVSIRLRREGAKNRPYYKVVVADSRSPRDGKFIEIIGTYDPKVAGENSTIKLDRAEHWLSRGAQASETVRSILKKNKARAETGAPDEAGGSEKTVPAKPKTTRAAKSVAPMPNEASSSPAEESAPAAEETSAPAETPAA